MQYTLYGTPIQKQLTQGIPFFHFKVPGSCTICGEKECICESRPTWSAKYNRGK